MSAKDRKGSRDKRKNNGNALAGTLFTAAMICCCVLIYLLSRGGRNTAKDTSMEIPPQPTAQMERVYPSVQVFFERAKGYGFDAEYTEDDGYAPDKGYTLKRGGLDGGALVLSMRNMGVCGFTLMIPAAAKPDDLPDDPTPVELSLYEQRLGRYKRNRRGQRGNVRGQGGYARADMADRKGRQGEGHRRRLGQVLREPQGRYGQKHNIRFLFAERLTYIKLNQSLINI